jgi:hypothetical protein
VVLLRPKAYLYRVVLLVAMVVVAATIGVMLVTAQDDGIPSMVCDDGAVIAALLRVHANQIENSEDVKGDFDQAFRAMMAIWLLCSEREESDGIFSDLTIPFNSDSADESGDDITIISNPLKLYVKTRGVLYECPNTDCGVIKVLQPGDELEALAQVNNGQILADSPYWYRVQYRGTDAYIHHKDISFVR